MTNYRRTYVPGATWFFTINLAERRSRLLVDRVDELRQALRYVRTRHPFQIDAMVVLPDHLHAIWTLPPGDSDYPLRWRLFKTWLSRHVPQGEPRRASLVDKSERGIWQRRYWEHLIRNEADLHSHIDYIHFNPVKHVHVLRTVDWPHSTFHRYVAKGILSADWGIALGRDVGFGERT
ncbi:REP-associated tyrosine transposase [Pseudoxanthomonas sacheonensis]|uniref:REP-associated tyrosine transposase n=1 Tax=Pseudoxanthomonas sacheonensis TaxID=443615 RepID=UPI0013D00019|nr:transposase [Pseudoxanthomonas sacheonensis]KAF1707491.1 transposase [Pseudoxanthomonas sacheonensis]